MTQALSGKNGEVNVGGVIGEVTAWSINPDMATPDATSCSGAGWAEFVAGIKSWSGSFETLVCANLFGSVAVGTFKTGGSSTPNFSGTVMIKGPAVALTVEGVVKYSYPFQGTGPLTISLT